MSRNSLSTRLVKFTAVTAAAVSMLAAASGASAGILDSIVDCSAPGGQQEQNAVIGGLLGGLAGNRVANSGDRGTGTVLGAVVGAAAGSYIGCKRQQDRVTDAQVRAAAQPAYYGEGAYMREAAYQEPGYARPQARRAKHHHRNH